MNPVNVGRTFDPDAPLHARAERLVEASEACSCVDCRLVVGTLRQLAQLALAASTVVVTEPQRRGLSL